MIKPKPNSIWKHHSGRLYQVLFLANDVEDPKPEYPVTVVYEDSNGKRWAGRLDDWHRRMVLVEEKENKNRNNPLLNPTLNPRDED